MVELKKKPTEEIIQELRRGLNREANYKLLFERYHDQVYRFFQRKGMSREDCRDLTQDVFVSVHKGLKGLREQGLFHTWLFKIARNIFSNELERNHAKKRAGRTHSLDDTASKQDEWRRLARSTTDFKAGPVEALLEKERREKLNEAIQNLPPQMQRCVQLRVTRMLSVEEVAAVMNISVNTVKAHLHQARRLLKEELHNYFSDAKM